MSNEQNIVCTGTGVTIDAAKIVHSTPVETKGLDAMLKLQAILETRMGYNFIAMALPELVAYIKEYTLQCTDELHEMLRELPYFKPWKKYAPDQEAVHKALEAARSEYIDVLHHVLNLALALDLSANDIFERFVAKNAVNHIRQEDTESYKKCID